MPPVPMNPYQPFIIAGIVGIVVVFLGLLANHFTNKSKDMVTADAASSSAPIVVHIGSSTSAALANPASTNCVKKGGTVEIVSAENGELGYCHLPAGKVCEEWSYYRGGCVKPGQTPSSSSGS